MQPWSSSTLLTAGRDMLVASTATTSHKMAEPNPALEAMNEARADYQNAKNERVEYEVHLQPALYDTNAFNANNLTTKV